MEGESTGHAPSPAQPATPAPAPAAAPAARRTAPLLQRILVGAAGIGLLVGFFLPWVRLADMVSLSGLDLILIGGGAIERMPGPYRTLLAVVPLAGMLLFAIAARGTRGIAWLGLACAFLICGIGLYTLISVFLDTIGPGMWIVTASTVVIMIVGLVAYRGATK